jgi:hypothetical protein
MVDTFWACCCCDDEWPTASEIPDADEHCGDNAWIVQFVDDEAGRRKLAHYRETYRSDLLK